MSDNLAKLKISRGIEEATPDKASAGAFSRWLETEKQRLRVLTYPSDYEADHVCYDGHAFYVVEGSLKIELGKEISEWGKGDAFIIPDGVPHRVLNPFESDASVVVVDNI